MVFVPPPPPVPSCRALSITGELQAGKGYSHALGNGLRLWFQPIASGWILRVVPATGPTGDHDYAELATPPYQSVSPLSLSTDFALRAQDAVGWNPRRFKYASSADSFARLKEVYDRFMQAGATPPAPLQVELSDQIAQASEGKLTILDARLTGGTADQSKVAVAVSLHFTGTAHTLVDGPGGSTTPLGRLLSVCFRVDLLLPPGFHPDSVNRVVPHLCGDL